MRLIDADSFLKHLHEPEKYGYSLLDHVISEPTVPAFGRWISVKDELPEPGRILVYIITPRHEHMQTDTVLNDGNEVFLDSGYNFGTDVTHWMPLPEPPEVE